MWSAYSFRPLRPLSPPGKEEIEAKRKRVSIMHDRYARLISQVSVVAVNPPWKNARMQECKIRGWKSSKCKNIESEVLEDAFQFLSDFSFCISMFSNFESYIPAFLHSLANYPIFHLAVMTTFSPGAQFLYSSV